MDSPVRGFSHVQLRVTDVEASVAWYSAVLGVEPAVDSLGGTVALVGNGGRYVVVISGNRPVGAGGEVDHLAFSIGSRDALTAWADNLAAAGIAHRGPVDAPEGLSIHLTDPDGLPIELIAP